MLELLKEIYNQRAGWVTSTWMLPVPCAVVISRLVENETVYWHTPSLISQTSNELNYRQHCPKFLNLCFKSFMAKIRGKVNK